MDDRNPGCALVPYRGTDLQATRMIEQQSYVPLKYTGDYEGSDINTLGA
jgi:hypothetical protein